MNITRRLKFFALLLLCTLALVPVALGEERKALRSAPAPASAPQETLGKTAERDAFVTTEVNRDSPYVGEQVIFRLKFFYRAGVTNASLDDLSVGGVQIKDMKEVSYPTVVNGIRYQVTEVSKLLIPGTSGDIRISGAVVRCETPRGSRQPKGNAFPGADFFDLGFPNTEPQILQSRPITLHVRPLPPTGKPSPFSGPVGSFTLSAELDKKEISAGESVTLTMTVTGKGDLSPAPRPAIQGLEQFQAYDDHPVTTEKIQDDQLVSVKIFKTALVPLKAGDLIIPEISLGFFDPETGAYRTASTSLPGRGLRVLSGSAQGMPPGIAGEASPTTTPPITTPPAKIAARDIFPIVTDSYHLLDEGLPFLIPLIFTALAAPPLLYVAILALRRKRMKFAAGHAGEKSTNALNQARKELAEAGSQATEQDLRETSIRLTAILKTYVGNKLHLACEAKTSDELEAAIRKRMGEGPLGEQTAALLQELERRRFAPRIAESVLSRDLVQETKNVIEQLEKVL